MSTKVSITNENSSVTVKYDGRADIAFTLSGKKDSVTLKDHEVAMCKNNLSGLAEAGSIKIEGGVTVKDGGGSKSGARTKDTPVVIDEPNKYLDILDGNLSELSDSLNELLGDESLTREDIMALRKAEEDGNTRTGAMELLDAALNEITE